MRPKAKRVQIRATRPISRPKKGTKSQKQYTQRVLGNTVVAGSRQEVAAETDVSRQDSVFPFKIVEYFGISSYRRRIVEPIVDIEDIVEAIVDIDDIVEAISSISRIGFCKTSPLCACAAALGGYPEGEG